MFRHDSTQETTVTAIKAVPVLGAVAATIYYGNYLVDEIANNEALCFDLGVVGLATSGIYSVMRRRRDDQRALRLPDKLLAAHAEPMSNIEGSLSLTEETPQEYDMSSRHTPIVVGANNTVKPNIRQSSSEMFVPAHRDRRGALRRFWRPKIGAIASAGLIAFAVSPYSHDGKAEPNTKKSALVKTTVATKNDCEVPNVKADGTGVQLTGGDIKSVAKVQAALQIAGYYRNKVDGKWGNKSAAAYTNYAKSRKLDDRQGFAYEICMSLPSLHDGNPATPKIPAGLKNITG